MADGRNPLQATPTPATAPNTRIVRSSQVQRPTEDVEAAEQTEQIDYADLSWIDELVINNWYLEGVLLFHRVEIIASFKIVANQVLQEKCGDGSVMMDISDRYSKAIQLPILEAAKNLSLLHSWIRSVRALGRATGSIALLRGQQIPVHIKDSATYRSHRGGWVEMQSIHIRRTVHDCPTLWKRHREVIKRRWSNLNSHWQGEEYHPGGSVETTEGYHSDESIETIEENHSGGPAEPTWRTDAYWSFDSIDIM